MAKSRTPIDFKEPTFKKNNEFSVLFFIWLIIVSFVIGMLVHKECNSDNYEFENHSEIPKNNY